MPGIQPVAIIDRAATPVTHNYVPVDVGGGEGSLVERLASGSFVGENKLFASNRVTPGRRAKCVTKLVFPKVVDEIINGVTVSRVIGTSYATVTLDWDPSHTAAERATLQGIVANSQGTAAAQPFLSPVMLGKEAVYGG